MSDDWYKPLGHLSVRAANALTWAAGINSLDELCLKTPSELLKVKNFGRSSLKEIQLALSGIGRSLAPDNTGSPFGEFSFRVDQAAIFQQAVKEIVSDKVFGRIMVRNAELIQQRREEIHAEQKRRGQIQADTYAELRKRVSAMADSLAATGWRLVVDQQWNGSWWSGEPVAELTKAVLSGVRIGIEPLMDPSVVALRSGLLWFQSAGARDSFLGLVQRSYADGESGVKSGVTEKSPAKPHGNRRKVKKS